MRQAHSPRIGVCKLRRCSSLSLRVVACTGRSMRCSWSKGGGAQRGCALLRILRRCCASPGRSLLRLASSSALRRCITWGSFALLRVSSGIAACKRLESPELLSSFL